NQEFETGNYDTSNLTRVVCGGSAAPKSLIKIYEEKFKIPFIHAYGMTETSPVAIVARLKSYQRDLPYEEQLEIRSKQGILVPGLDGKMANERGEAARDGREIEAMIRQGAWMADSQERANEHT